MKPRLLVTCVLACLGALLASQSALAVVTRWRVDGNACQQFQDGTSRYLWAYGSVGAFFSSHDGFATEVSCAIPVGESLLSVDPNDANVLSYVAVRMYQSIDDSTLTETRLFAHDDASDDFCECSQDDRTGADGFFQTLLYFGGQSGICDTCVAGGYVPNDWVLTVEVNNINDSGGSTDNRLTVKRVTAYSEN